MTGPIVAIPRGTARWAQAVPAFEHLAADMWRIGLLGECAEAQSKARHAMGRVQRGVEHANPRGIRPDLPLVVRAWERMHGIAPDRAHRIPCPRRAVLWHRSGYVVPGTRVDQTAMLVCHDGPATYSAELERDTRLFLEVREGPPPAGATDRPEGDLGPLVARLDLDGEEIERPGEVEPVLFGEQNDEDLLIAELALERGGWSVKLVGGG